MNTTLLLIGIVGTIIGIAVAFNGWRMRSSHDAFAMRMSLIHMILGISAIVLTWLLIVGLF